MIRVESHKGGVRFVVHVRPRASRTEIVGEHDQGLKIRVAAPPVEGAANAELMSFLAKVLGVARSSVRVVKGEHGRHKVVEVDGVTPGAVTALLE